MLMSKLVKASTQTGINNIAIAGGVSANSGLRSALEKTSWNVFIPPIKYCTDNAAMVGMVGVFDFEKKRFGKLSDTPSPRLPDIKKAIV